MSQTNIEEPEVSSQNNSEINSRSHITIAKFGGTSLADYNAMLRCAHIIKNDPSNRVVIVSASAGVTNFLVQLSEGKLSFDTLKSIVSKVLLIQKNITQYLPNQIKNHLNNTIDNVLNDLSNCAKQQIEKFSAKNADEILAFGEQLSALIFTEILKSINVNTKNFDVKRVMKTNSLYGKAVVDIKQLKVACDALLVPKLLKRVIVTQGFTGEDAFGSTTTLGRGGSDYSAALLAEALNANNLAIWTDVIGIFTTDPRITNQAKSIKEISFGEAAEMATFGAKILHPATLIPAMRKNIPVFVGSSKEPKKGGTRITQKVASNPTYRSIALRREQVLVTVKSPEMLHASGFLAKVFTILAKHELSVDLITTSEISIALTFDNPKGSPQSLITNDVVKELEQFCEVTIESNLSLIAVIGNELNNVNGIGHSIFETIDDINIRLICHGASSHNLCFLVNEDDANTVVERLHNTLFFIDAA